MRTIGVVLICAIIGVLGGGGFARADDCDVVWTASIAQAKVPHAVAHVMTQAGQPPNSSSMIFMGDKAYVQANGDWQALPFSAQQQIDMASASKERAQQIPHTCEKLPGQSINGEATSQYLLHTTADGNAVEARFWISTKTGLPLKSEVHLGDGTAITDEFRYDNIQAPPAAK